MNRHAFEHDGLTLSFLDAGGDGRPLVALHAHWMEGLTYAPLAQGLAPAWRVIALDQRGHGHSDHARTYCRDDYLDDLEALFTHLGLHEAVMLGNSLGGVNAYQFPARHPGLVRAMVIEDIGVQINDDARSALKWAGTFKTRADLIARIGSRMAPYLKDSMRQTAAGWRLAFEPADIVSSQKSLNGDHWDDWLATTCPALLIHGVDSPVTKQTQVDQMVARRPNTRVVSLSGGHVVHVDSHEPFVIAVRTFLDSL
jgi:esterase